MTSSRACRPQDFVTGQVLLPERGSGNQRAPLKSQRPKGFPGSGQSSPQATFQALKAIEVTEVAVCSPEMPRCRMGSRVGSEGAVTALRRCRRIWLDVFPAAAAVVLSRADRVGRTVAPVGPVVVVTAPAQVRASGCWLPQRAARAPLPHGRGQRRARSASRAVHAADLSCLEVTNGTVHRNVTIGDDAIARHARVKGLIRLQRIYRAFTSRGNGGFTERQRFFTKKEQRSSPEGDNTHQFTANTLPALKARTGWKPECGHGVTGVGVRPGFRATRLASVISTRAVGETNMECHFRSALAQAGSLLAGLVVLGCCLLPAMLADVSSAAYKHQLVSATGLNCVPQTGRSTAAGEHKPTPKRSTRKPTRLVLR